MGIWTAEEDAFLEGASSSHTVQQLADVLNRAPHTVRWRCGKLGLTPLDGRSSPEARAAVSVRRTIVERTETQQRCTQCEKWKLYEEFALDKSSPSGHNSKCKVCVRGRWQEWYEADPEMRRRLGREATQRFREKQPGYKPAVVYRIDEHGRECSKCREYKPWPEFHQSNPKSAVCKPCWREHVRKSRLVREFGITVEQYEWLEEQQGGVCFLCDEKETTNHHKSGTLYYLSIDHDHGCGRHPAKQACPHCIRALLCGLCNRTVGGAEKRPAVAVRFADYLPRRPLLQGD